MGTPCLYCNDYSEKGENDSEDTKNEGHLVSCRGVLVGDRCHGG